MDEKLSKEEQSDYHEKEGQAYSYEVDKLADITKKIQDFIKTKNFKEEEVNKQEIDKFAIKHEDDFVKDQISLEEMKLGLTNIYCKNTFKLIECNLLDLFSEGYKKFAYTFKGSSENLPQQQLVQTIYAGHTDFSMKQSCICLDFSQDEEKLIRNILFCFAHNKELHAEMIKVTLSPWCLKREITEQLADYIKFTGKLKTIFLNLFFTEEDLLKCGDKIEGSELSFVFEAIRRNKLRTFVMGSLQKVKIVMNEQAQKSLKKAVSKNERLVIFALSKFELSDIYFKKLMKKAANNPSLCGFYYGINELSKDQFFLAYEAFKSGKVKHAMLTGIKCESTLKELRSTCEKFYDESSKIFMVGSPTE